MFTKDNMDRARECRAMALSRSYVVKYSTANRGLVDGRSVGVFNMATKKDCIAGPFNFSKKAEDAIVDLMRRPHVIPWSIELVERENDEYQDPPSPHLGQLVLTNEAIL